MTAIRWSHALTTLCLCAATTLVSIVIWVSGGLNEAATVGGFVPANWSGNYAAPGLARYISAILTPLSATLIHAGPVHLLLNLVMLAFCGAQVERALGHIGTSLIYIIGAYGAAVGQWLPTPMNMQPMIGASGAISALVAAYALLYAERVPRRIGPISGTWIHIAWLAAAWIGIQALIGAAGMRDGARIAIAAHIGGFLTGLALTRPLFLWRYRTA